MVKGDGFSYDSIPSYRQGRSKVMVVVMTIYLRTDKERSKVMAVVLTTFMQMGKGQR